MYKQAGRAEDALSTAAATNYPILALLALFLVAVACRISVLATGSPFITIDDKTAFEGGFMVWFGQAPPQRMYIESWIYGVVCLGVYATKCLTGLASGGLNINFIADAYRDFYGHPDAYVLVYRIFTLIVDLATALLVFLIARRVVENRWRGWAAVCAAGMFLLSYNTIWSGVVARPDSLLTFFCTLGLLLYLKSNLGQNLGWLLASAVILGVAAGQKLHGAFLVIFLCVDLLRVHGLKAAAPRIVLLAGVSGFFFCVATGSLLFDPLTYVKLRMANYGDDLSLWMKPGGQFWTMLRGSGWLAIPLALVGIWHSFSGRRPAEQDAARTMAVIVVGWLLLFASIRQLRAYWMLPALPVLYIVAVYGAISISRQVWGKIAVSALLVVLAVQSVLQIQSLRVARYDGLRSWIVEHVGERPFYILGYDALILPKNTRCIERTREVLLQLIEVGRGQGVTFTERHIRNWEERSALKLLDILDFRFEGGYEFYDFHSSPPDVLDSIVSLREMHYLIVQDGFDLDRAPSIRDGLAKDYVPVAETYGAGGGKDGLKYTIYKKK